jgi:hypothetical protein
LPDAGNRKLIAVVALATSALGCSRRVSAPRLNAPLPLHETLPGMNYVR